MENSLKQRIIGAIVLIALAIIFLPAILKEKTSSGTFVSKIPEKPQELADYQVDTKKIDDLMADKQEKPANEQKSLGEGETSLAGENNPEIDEVEPKVDLIDEKIVSSNRKVKTDSNKEDKSVSPPAIVEQPRVAESTISDKYQDAAWVIQVASFSKVLNATNLVKKLKNKSYKAYRREFKTADKTVFRVFVGPYIEKQAAEKALDGVSQLSESTALIRVFDPFKH